MYRVRILLLLLLPLSLCAQVADNFADGDFTANPAWVGNTADFQIDNGWLRSNGPQASSFIYLSTPNIKIDSAEWNFLLRLDFNPSSTNQVRIYLVSDQQDLSGSLNGYFVQFGEAGTAPDSLDIFRQDGNTVTKVFTGASGIMNTSSTNSVRIRVVRKTGGVWDVFADNTGGTNLISEGSFTDNNITTTSYFGVACDYTTASRYNLYFFDDISVGNIVSDTTKPTVAAVDVLTNTTVDVQFSEPVDAATAETESNYSINNGIGSPSSAVRDAVNFSLVHLTFSNAFQNATNYVLNISGVKDQSGNSMNAYSFPFAFFNALPYDILINEIMADPTPVVGLPEVEFVELYNTTAFPVNVAGWTFSDASTSVTLPGAVLLPDSFAILVAAANVDSFPASIQKISVSSLPSLNNTGDNLQLKNNFGTVIHTINYLDDWYNNSSKAAGGWTLELINPDNPCKSTNNWTASNDVNGGTPGKRNSVYNTAGSLLFSLIGVEVISATEIVLSFTESVSQSLAETESNYNISNGTGAPADAKVDSFDFTKVHIYFSTALDSNLIYTITATISNCAGTSVSAQNSFQFAIPKSADKFDVIINEIFPDPDPQIGLPAAEYVELHNRSNKAINLKDWDFSKAGSSSATLPSYLLLPDSFVILTSNTNSILFSAYSNVLPLSSFPALTNDGDNLLLKNNAGNLIHYVPYDLTWYNDLGKQDGGWSMELIDADNPCNGKENWRASSDASGGTPGRKNSVVANNPDTVKPNLIRAALQDENTLLLYFSEPVNNGIAANAFNYVISNGVGAPALAFPVPFAYNTVQLEFLTSFSKGVIYTVKVNNLSDCSGNILLVDTALFAIADTALAGDVVINEILFNPRTAGYDFVELYNRSNKVIDLRQLIIQEKQFDAPDIVLETASCSNESYLLFPQQYVVLTESADNIRLEYFCNNPSAIVEMDLPNYDDNESICILKSATGETIDSLAYLNDWHFVLLDDEDGVSLERIDFSLPAQDPANWHSAASTVGFATPTYLNSQYSETGISEDAISISPEVFTPNNDGDKDFTFIQYAFSEPGYTCNIRLFDAKGREIKYLVRSELLGSSGQFQWDGTDDDGRKARTGIYIAHIEVFNLQGKVKRYKRNIVLGARLD